VQGIRQVMFTGLGTALLVAGLFVVLLGLGLSLVDALSRNRRIMYVQSSRDDEATQ
jgi:hypothetical protein